MDKVAEKSGVKPELRSLLKSGVAEGLVRCGLHKLVGSARSRTGAPLVLGYHRVVENFAATAALTMPSLLVSTATLARQLEWAGRNYEFVSLDELALVLDGVIRKRKPVAVVTFDDGYRDVLEQGLPLLQRMGIPATVYVVSDLTGTDRLLRHDELYLLFALLLRGDDGNRVLQQFSGEPELLAQLQLRIARKDTPFQLVRYMLETWSQQVCDALLDQLRTRVPVDTALLQSFRALDWDMLQQWLRAGMTVGSHTCSHPLLPGLPALQARVELQRSRNVLEACLGVPVRHFAYPDGRFDAPTVRAVAAAGYRTATTICGHLDPQYPHLTIPRRMLWENSSNDAIGHFSPAVLNCQVNGIFDPADRCRLHH